VWLASLVVLALLCGCTRTVQRVETRRLLIVVQPCVAAYPRPAPVTGSAAQLADAYVDLDRWVRLVLTCPQ
jgi:hypothetical protein